MRIVALVVVFVVFTGWSLSIVQSDGLSGLASLLMRERWSVQLFVDLAITSVVAWAWLRRDAREKGITAWPYMIATAAVGSIGVMGYLLHREWVSRRQDGLPSPRPSSPRGEGDTGRSLELR